MKRPSFQFYPGDWSANPNLRRCTFAEKGVWLDVMCLMHDQDEYGVLRWPLKEIAQAVGCKVSDLLSLARKGVLKGADDSLTEPFIYTPRSGRKDGNPVTLVDTQAGPIWYSSRMVKDEYVRTIRGESGSNGDPPKRAPKAAPKPPIGEAFGPRDSSSSSSASAKESASALSARARVGAALIASGLDKTTVNTADPRLMALIEQGATPAEFEGVGREAVAKGKGVAWVLVTLAARRTEAAAMAARPGKHAGFQAKDYREGVASDGSFS